MPPDVPGANDYDGFAEAYAAEVEDNLVNAHYERPAILDLAGDVSGRRILDAGCGSGALTAALRDRGATVTGIDSSAKMLELAQQRLGADADLRLVDLQDPLPFADGEFDDVVASLVLHYLQDWGPTLAEMRRVLTPGGHLIASVEHPFKRQAQAGPGADYLAIRPWSFEWVLGGQQTRRRPWQRPLRARMQFWHRPLSAMTDAFTAAGFRISAIREPQPLPEARERFPEQFAALRTSPCFVFFVLEAEADAGSPDEGPRTGAQRPKFSQ